MNPLQKPCESIAKEYDAALLDLDGVVYVDEDAVPGVVPALNQAHAMSGIALTYVTNNAARSTSTIAQHLNELGLEVTPEEVVTSAQAGASELAKIVPQGASVFVCGSRDLMHEVELVGLKASQVFEAHHEAVINGYWPDMPWRMLGQVAGLLNTGIAWVVTNMDLTIPTKFGPAPGNGAMVNSLIHSTGRVPTVIAGKPQKPLMQASIDRTRANHPILIGDRLDSDILGANNVGIDSLLVLSGVTSIAELINATPTERPTYIWWDASGILQSQPKVEVSDSQAKIDGFTVDQSGLQGRGDALNAIRVCAVANWVGLADQEILLRQLHSRGIG